MEENREKSSLKTNPFSFRAAFDSLPRNKQSEVKRKIMNIIHVTTEKSVWDRINGNIEPKVSEAKAFEQLFRSYGIKIVWGANSEEQ
jgi:trehalose utilization protein